MVPLPFSALPAVVAIAIPGVIVVHVVSILVIAAHVIVERQDPGCRAIKSQALGNRVAIPWMKIGRIVGTRRRSKDRAGSCSGQTASVPSAHPIATRSKNCTKSGSQWIKPLTSLTCYAAPGGAPVMTTTTTEGGVSLRQCGVRTTTTRGRTTTVKYGAIVGGDPPFRNDDDNSDHDTNNDADVEGLCFQHVHTRHQCRKQANLALQPHDGEGERLLCHWGK